MQPEQQQRIMGYFIEEAKDHLNTIEQGLLSLQSTMEDTEMLNEVFRAAHSVKGGAAMLGLNSIQHTAHRLEDCFKVLQESPVKPDGQLESLFLRVFDTLEALIEQLQGPFGLTEEVATKIMSEAEPVFEELNTHLKELVKQAESSTVVTAEAPRATKVRELEETAPLLQTTQLTQENTTVLPATFKRDVLIELREMLQLFKQQDSPEHRQTLQTHCDRLAKLGEQLDLPGWGELLETSKAVIAYSQNSYRQLASLVIKEIKQAQELVLANRSVEITPSEQLQALVPAPAFFEEITAFDLQDQESLLTDDTDFEAEFTDYEPMKASDNAAADVTSATNPVHNPHLHIQHDTEELNSQTRRQEELVTELDSPIPSLTSEFQSSAMELQFDSTNIASRLTDFSDPEVGVAELNSLADIFEGQTPDLDQTWQEEEIISLDDKPFSQKSENSFSLDNQSDFSDFINDIDGVDMPTSGATTSDDLMGWFGDDTPEDGIFSSQESTDSLFDEPHPKTTPSTTNSAALESLRTSDFSDLLFEADSPEPLATPSTNADEITNLFGDSFFDEDSSDTNESTDLDADTLAELQQRGDDLLAMPMAEELDFLANGRDFLSEGFIGDENGSFVFEDSFALEQDDWSNEESRLDEAAFVGSELDLGDFLEISDVSIPEGRLAPSDELLIDDKETDFDFDDLALDESQEDVLSLDALNYPDNGLSALSLEEEGENALDTGASNLDWDFMDTPTVAPIAESETDSEAIAPWDLSSSFEETAQDESLLDWDELNFASQDIDLAGINLESQELAELPATASTSDLDLDLDQTPSTNFFDFDEPSDGDVEDLFGDEILPEDSNAATASSLAAASLTPSLEAPGDVASNLEVSDDLFEVTADTEALTFDEFNLDSLDSLEESEIVDLDAFNDFFDTDSEATETSASDRSLDLEFSMFGTSATSDADSTEVAIQTSAPEAEAEDLAALLGGETSVDTDALDLPLIEADALNFEEDLFANEQSSPAWDLGIEEATTEAPAPMFDWELSEESPKPAYDSAASNVEEASLPMSDLDALLGSETSSDIDALDNLEENLFDTETPSLWELESSDGAADALLDWEGAEAEQTTENLEDLFDTELDTAPEELSVSNLQNSEFDDLEAMLAGTQAITSLGASAAVPTASLASSDIDVFDDLEALLGEQIPAAAEQPPAPVKSTAVDADIVEDGLGEDLEKLLEQADKAIGGPPIATPNQGATRPPIRQTRQTRLFEQTMRVPIKHLDSLSNLVGELVVNRNSLEQDQERLRQFLDNLSHQVLALSDVGARMQDLYERSLLESSLLASRHGYRSTLHSEDSSHQSHSSGVEYDPLEMDRFTGFHLLSQEMIELIVRVRESAADIEFLVDETDQVARMLRQITTQLQEGLTRSRMVPFDQTADRLRRAVREISLKLRKEAQLNVEGRETLIDKMILELLYDPMTHLVNNALTHGIESPEVRKAAGKPPIGKITLRAFHQGNQTVIAISDDGAGIDPERVRKKAIQQRLISPAEAKNLTNLELYDFLFRPGFTTKDKEDEYAGRGVGMDVVRTSLYEIRGSIHIDSILGKGTTFTIRLPLTLSIGKALCCLSDRARLAFPMDGVEDMMDIASDRVQINSEGQTCIHWRDTLLPFQPLSELLTYNRHLSRGTVYGGKREDDLISIVVLRSAGNFIAIQVDQVLGEQEIVIKQLEGPAPKPVGVAGATVLGDGRIMPIADVLELIDLAMGRIRKDGGVTLWAREETSAPIPDEAPEAKTEPMVLIVDDSITVRELLSMTFSKSGYRVEQARDGQEAWEKLRSGLPCDLVFCDIEMPRMDGLELLSRLQKDDNLSHLPIAMLTSRGADRHRQMASQLGARGYFTKPYLEEVLLDAAQRMIKGEVLFSASSNA
ncbi:MAG TPA: response regulator [Coleofasciculaceae cyanobacterium]|jgi:chemosensory pili system protein ChpA (sensor histidine kinase/response regulator)